MKKEFRYNIITAIVLLLFFSSAALCQQKRIGEFVEIPHTDSTFSKSMPLGSVVLDTTNKELYRLSSYTLSGTSLTNANKVLISGGASIYTGSDTIPNGTVATLASDVTFSGLSGGINIDNSALFFSANSFNITQRNFANAFNVSMPTRLGTDLPFIGINTNVVSNDEMFKVNGKSIFEDNIKITGVGATSSTYSFIANDNVANTNFYIRDDGAVSSRLGYWVGGEKVFHLTGSSTGASNQNVWLGQNAGSSISNGLRNVSIGSRSGQFLTTGDNNTHLGVDAGRTLSNGSNTVLLGYYAGGPNNFSNSVGIGAYVEVDGNNQFVTGSRQSVLKDYYIGRGIKQTTGNLGVDGVNINATRATGTDADATSFDMCLIPSRGTGTGTGSSIIIKSAITGVVSNATANTVVDALTIKPNRIVVSNVSHNFEDGISFDGTDKWEYMELDIGDWNMQTNKTDTISHGIANWKTIRSISVIIRNDDDDSYSQLSAATLDNTNNGVLEFTSSKIILERVGDGGSGRYMNENYNDTSYNRGYITFWYKL